MCVRCGCQVVVCGYCDRGQIYCDGDCSRQARRQTLHGAGRRWQRTPHGRRMHAARMARYRARQREIVTHHGSPPPALGDQLASDATVVPRNDASEPSCSGGQWVRVKEEPRRHRSDGPGGTGCARPACRTPPLPGEPLASWIAALRAFQFFRAKRPFSGAIVVGNGKAGQF